MSNSVRRPAFPPDSTIADAAGEFVSFCLRAGISPEGTKDGFMAAVSAWDSDSENASKPVSLTATVPGVGKVSYSYRVILSGDEPRARTYFSFVPDSGPAETFPTVDGMANRVYSAVGEMNP